MSPENASKFLKAAQTILQTGEETKETQAQPQDQSFRPQGIEGGTPAPRRAPIQNGIRRGGTLQDLAPYEEGDEIIPVMPGENLMDAYERKGRSPQSVNAPFGQSAGTQFDQIEQAPSRSVQMPAIGLEGIYNQGRPTEPTEENLDQLMQDMEQLPEPPIEPEQTESQPMTPEQKKEWAEGLFGGDEGEKQRADAQQKDLESYERLTAPSKLMKRTYQMPRSAGVSMENLMNQAREVIPTSRK